MKYLRLFLFAAALPVLSIVARGADEVPKDYPLTKCPVSDEKLGEHGKPVKMTAPDGTVVYLCCNDCKEDFEKEPAKYAQMVKDAKAKK